MNFYFKMLMVCVFATFFVFQCHAETTLSRQDIAGYIGGNIIFTGDALQSESERQAYIQSLGIDELLQSFCPQSVVFEDKQLIGRFSTSKIFLENKNDQYNSLLIKKHAMDVLLMNEQWKLIPVIDNDTQDAINKSLETLSDGMALSFKKHFEGEIPEEMVNYRLDKFKLEMMSQINDKNCYALKVPMQGEDIKRLVEVFDKRLEASIERANKRIKDAEEAMATENKVAFSGGGEDVDNYKDFTIAKIITESIRPLKKQVYTETSAPQLENFNPDTIVPGYSEVVEKISRIRAEDQRKRLQDTNISRRKQMIKKAFSLENVIDDALDDPVDVKGNTLPMEETVNNALSDLDVTLKNESNTKQIVSNIEPDTPKDTEKLSDSYHAEPINKRAWFLTSIGAVIVLAGIIVVAKRS